MAGITNTTAKQFNLRALTKDGRIVTVRIAPGFNVVDDAHWEAFVDKKGKVLVKYVDEIAKKGFIKFGKSEDDKELEQDPDTKAKSKSEKLPKKKTLEK